MIQISSEFWYEPKRRLPLRSEMSLETHDFWLRRENWHLLHPYEWKKLQLQTYIVGDSGERGKNSRIKNLYFFVRDRNASQDSWTKELMTRL